MNELAPPRQQLADVVVLHEIHEVGITDVLLKRRISTRVWHPFTLQDIRLSLEGQIEIRLETGFLLPSTYILSTKELARLGAE